jgi:hypothetical protein
MVRRLSKQGLTWLTVVVFFLTAFFGAHAAQGQSTMVRLELLTKSPRVGEGTVSVSVVVEQVTNLGAFEFELTYDEHILELQDVQEGPFLGSSGRRAECLPPETAAGSLLFRCVTLGATPDGPTGSGVLATVTFQPAGAGTSPIHFARLVLTDPPANPLAATGQDASITVEEAGGFDWALWGPVLGGVAGAVVAIMASAWYVRRRWRR